ncbi:hypothetical protein C8R46DRAFT_1050807 [Mycena filopes]|nr:hypothetical protein C8R46DRAFT_1050807 [Mycena filopes]
MSPANTNDGNAAAPGAHESRTDSVPGRALILWAPPAFGYGYAVSAPAVVSISQGDDYDDLPELISDEESEDYFQAPIARVSACHIDATYRLPLKREPPVHTQPSELREGESDSGDLQRGEPFALMDYSSYQGDTKEYLYGGNLLMMSYDVSCQFKCGCKCHKVRYRVIQRPGLR